MLTTGGSSGPGPLQELSGPYRRAPEAAAARLPRQQSACIEAMAASLHRGAAFQVQKLLAQHPERGALPPGRQIMLAAYRAHLAGRIRYFGPLAPIDLRV